MYVVTLLMTFSNVFASHTHTKHSKRIWFILQVVTLNSCLYYQKIIKQNGRFLIHKTAIKYFEKKLHFS